MTGRFCIDDGEVDGRDHGLRIVYQFDCMRLKACQMTRREHAHHAVDSRG